MVIDHLERRVWCKDCEQTVDSFEAFKIIAEAFEGASKAHAAKVKAFNEAIKEGLFSRAAKALDNEWRKRKTVPCCPHCNIDEMEDRDFEDFWVKGEQTFYPH